MLLLVLLLQHAPGQETIDICLSQRRIRMHAAADTINGNNDNDSPCYLPLTLPLSHTRWQRISGATLVFLGGVARKFCWAVKQFGHENNLHMETWRTTNRLVGGG